METRTQPFPVIVTSGSPAVRGFQYGEQARPRIRAAILGYERVFRHYAGWEWSTVRRHASSFERWVAEFSPDSLAEIDGIARGAGVERADIMALNTRSEIMFAARNAATPAECTSFAVLPQTPDAGPLLAGQNWDWLEFATTIAVVLVAHRATAPDFVTVAEAGTLAKVGLNETGLTLCTNTLISDGDEGRPGVPYHVLLRSVLDAPDLDTAVDVICSADRACSANYLLSDGVARAVDLETAPTTDGWRRIEPSNGAITHSNHFLTDGLTGEDRYLKAKPHSLDRLDSIRRRLDSEATRTVADLKAVLADHESSPSSVCQHARAEVHPVERTLTVAGVVLDPSTTTMHYTCGQPCTAGWNEVGLSAPTS